MADRPVNYVVASCVTDLRSVLSAFGDDALFRGQVAHHTNADGSVNMPTSFARRGCVPPQMLKWMHYADSVIRALQGPDGPAPSTVLSQAILQHYGWRSFYVDATSDPAVGGWFASHAHSSKVQFDFCEDCFEKPVFLVIDKAQYRLSDAPTGHLYVISKERLALSGTGVVDLCQEITSESRLRFFAQGASLLGPLPGNLPTQCVVAHIEAPVSVLEQFANEAGYRQADNLFPSPDEDPVLKLLLATPWTRGEVDIAGIPTFTQGLRLPQYQHVSKKHLSPHVALYSGTWVDDERLKENGLLGAACFLRVPEEYAYGQPLRTFKFPRLSTLLRTHGCVVIEFAGLYRYAELSESSDYNKGVVLTRTGDDVCIAALLVGHPGTLSTGHGVDMGWYYRMSLQGEWTRAPGSTDCSCNAPHRHVQHLCAIERVEQHLATGPAIGADGLSIRLANA